MHNSRFCWEPFRSFETTLDDSTTIRMQTEMLDLVKESFVDEPDGFGSTALDGFLDDMIAILIFDALQDVVLQLTNKCGLLFHEDVLERLLHNSTAVHLQAQSEDLTSHLIRKQLLVLLVAVVEKLLDDIISEHVSHQRNGVWFDFPEDTLFLVRVCSLQLGLDESGAILIAGKLCNVVEDIAELPALIVLAGVLEVVELSALDSIADQCLSRGHSIVKSTNAVHLEVRTRSIGVNAI